MGDELTEEQKQAIRDKQAELKREVEAAEERARQAGETN